MGNEVERLACDDLFSASRRWRRCRRPSLRAGWASAPPSGFRPLPRAGLEVRCRVALDRHATEIADVAFVIAAGIERQDIAGSPHLVGGRAVEARPRRDEAIFERQAPVHLFAAKRFDDFRFRRPWPVRGDHRQHGIDHEFGGCTEEIQFFPGLARPQAFERHMRFHESHARQLARHEFRRVGGQERTLDADALQFRRESLRDDRPRAQPSGSLFPTPETRGYRICRALSRKLPSPGRYRSTGPAPFDVNENGQIAADADRVEMVEEKEPVAAEQILDVVLGRDDQRVDAGLVEERVKARAVKWRRCGFSAFANDSAVGLSFMTSTPADLARSEARPHSSVSKPTCRHSHGACQARRKSPIIAKPPLLQTKADCMLTVDAKGVFPIAPTPFLADGAIDMS